jgi:hypothetical protein
MTECRSPTYVQGKTIGRKPTNNQHQHVLDSFPTLERMADWHSKNPHQYRASIAPNFCSELLRDSIDCVVWQRAFRLKFIRMLQVFPDYGIARETEAKESHYIHLLL